MSVSSVSLEEINEIRSNMPVVQQIKSAPKKTAPATSKLFIDKFSDSKIADFFEPYGYVSHERNDSLGAVFVLCEDCHIIFDDFTVIAEPAMSFFTNNLKFDFSEFASECEKINSTPSQAISDRLENEVFNKMPYYVERKKEFNENNLNNASRGNKYANLLSTTIKKQQHRENFSDLNKQYGSSDPLLIADTLSRLTKR